MSHVVPQPDMSEGPSRRWFPLNIGTALAAAVIVSLLAFLLTSDGGSPVASASDADELARGESSQPGTLAEPVPITEADLDAAEAAPSEEQAFEGASPTTIAVAETIARNGGGDAAATSSSSVLALAREITNMGSTEVGFVTNFPSVEYTWDRVEIATEGQFDVGWLGELGGKIVVVSPTWDGGFEGSGQSLVTSVSTDGTAWETASRYELPPETWVSRVVSDGERVYAFAETWEEGTGQNAHFLYTTSDGASWSVIDLELGAGSDEHVYIQNAAAGPAGLVVFASFEMYPEEQPALLDFGEFQVELDHMRNHYALIEASSGDEVLRGPIDDLFSWGPDGQRVYDPETGELLVTVPHEVWEQAYSYHYEGYGGGSPLPVPISSPEPVTSPDITIEYSGFLVTVDEYESEYSVADAEAGEVIASGTLDYLYQGPPPFFVDPETGEVLLSVTWDEWHRAEEQVYVHYETEFHDHQTRTVLLTSTDGENWDAAAMPTRSDSHVSYIVATDDGFVAMVNTWGELGEQRSAWTMNGGEWSSSVSDYSDIWLYQVADAGDWLVGVGEGPGGMALWSSADGIDWVSEFAVVPQDDGSHASLIDVTADETGTVAALAYREKWSEFQPLIIEKDGYTLTFEDGETALTVASNSGETVLVVGWDDHQESSPIRWGDGVTYIDLGNGDTIAITDEEAYAELDSRWADQGVVGLSVFLNDGGVWSEAMVEVEGSLSGAQQIYLVDGKIFIGGAYWGGAEPYRSYVPAGGSFVVLVGTPIGG